MKRLKQWGELRISKWHFRLVSLINTAFLFLSLLHYYLVLVLSAASSPHIRAKWEKPAEKNREIDMPAIIWQIFDMKEIKPPETKMRPICWELLGKNRETITSELILWRILTFWNHCVPQCLFPAIPSYPISTHLIFVNFKGGLLHNRTEQLQLLLQLT